MIGFNKMKVGMKLMVSTALLVAGAVALISIILGVIVQKMAENHAKELAKETASHYANIVKVELEIALDEARALAHVFGSAVNTEDFELTREEANVMLKYFIEQNPNFISVYVAFEPNAFDDNDMDFVDQQGHDETGRFIPSWTRDKDGSGFLEPLLKYEEEGDGDYYQLPKKRNQECVIEPYMYPIQGKEVLITSLVAPISDNNNNFIGIAGLDLALDRLQQLVRNIEIPGFKNAYVTFYSAKGTVVGSKEASYTGKHLEYMTDSQQLIDNVLKQKPFFMTRQSSSLEATVLTYGTPVEIGKTGSRWVVTVNIPEQELNAEATQMLVFTVIFGIGVLLLAIVIIYFQAKSLVTPLVQVNEHLKILAKGQPSKDNIEYQGKDEIAEIVMFFRQLREAIRNTIEQADAIAAGDCSNEVRLLSDDDQLGQALTKMIGTLRDVIQQANAIAAGDYSHDIKLLSEKDQLGRALSEMTQTLRDVTAKNARQDWLKTGQNQLNEQMSGEQNLVNLAHNIVSFLTLYLEAQVGMCYLVEHSAQEKSLLQVKLLASYAYTRRKNLAEAFQFSEGLIERAAKDQESVILTINSGLGEEIPRNLIVLPFLYENAVKGVIVLGSVKAPTAIQLEFLHQVMSSIGIAVNSIESQTKMQELLQQTQTQAEELQTQTAELQTQKEELQSQSEELQNQTEELQTQAEELRQTNETLEERSTELELQKKAISEKNQVLEESQRTLQAKAEELELASKYKSEFLANMSHELRTPLNSMLILAQLLVENKNGNLTDKQVEYGRTIYSAGSDLLTLINEILDLSKVESGKMEIQIDEISTLEIVETIGHKFRHVAEEKGLAFHSTMAEDVPPFLNTDVQRLKQVISNLLSNAFKFTNAGEVKLTVHRPSKDDTVSNLSLELDKTIAISVTDTGIGIPTDKQQLIFRAFQQVDGTTSRRYGGTGLGLSISRQFARLLGGELLLHSIEGKGSTFTLYLPENLEKSSGVQKSRSSEGETVVPLNRTPSKTDELLTVTTSTNAETQETNVPATDTERKIVDDRGNLTPEDKSILIIEDDRKFSSILLELAREQDFKCLVAEDGKTGLQLAEQYKPNAIILDVSLPQMDGWTVMERLKDNSNTRHIPVHFMSASDYSTDAKKMGAIGYLLKPVSMGELGQAFKKIEQFLANTVKNLLIVTDNLLRQQKIMELVGEGDVKTTSANTIENAVEHLYHASFDCLILDVEIEPGAGFKLLKQLQSEEQLSQLPVIIYAERDLLPPEEALLQRYTNNLTVKTVRSPERLLDEATLFLHQVEANLPDDKRKMLEIVHDKTVILKDKKVLLVDDDMRNVFALATVLENKDMEVIIAENGKEALTKLEEEPDINLILMDIMMPEMDGYEAIQKIRQQPRFQKLPIIALTAKAMKSDKTKCIEAGANDYISKPVDTDKLTSLMRVWLYR
jgi:signal transduction histidine kinase/DNA-binding response OmpR family regulator